MMSGTGQGNINRICWKNNFVMTYTENALIEQPAIKLFDDLEWDN